MLVNWQEGVKWIGLSTQVAFWWKFGGKKSLQMTVISFLNGKFFHQDPLSQ